MKIATPVNSNCLTFCYSENSEIIETTETTGNIEDLKELHTTIRNYHRGTLSNYLNYLTPPLSENIEDIR